MVSFACEVFLICEITQKDRIANLFTPGNLYGSFISFEDVNAHLGAVSFPYGSKFSTEEFYNNWRDFKITCVQGIPSFIMPALRNIKKLYPDFELEKLIYAGEPLSVADHRWLENELNTSTILSIIGTTEAGVIAYRAPKQTHFKTLQDYNYIEVVDEKNRLVEEGQTGRMLVTTLEKSSFPLIRYDIGDQARLRSFKRNSLEIDYLGRHDNIISIGFNNINVNDIDPLLDKFSPSHIQYVANRDNNVDIVSILMETQKKVSESDIIDSIVKNNASILEAIEEKCLKIVAHSYLPGEIKRDQRTGKVKKIIDNRF